MACDRDKRGCGRPTMSFHLKHACGAGKTFFDSRFMDLHFERGVSRLLYTLSITHLSGQCFAPRPARYQAVQRR